MLWTLLARRWCRSMPRTLGGRRSHQRDRRAGWWSVAGSDRRVVQKCTFGMLYDQSRRPGVGCRIALTSIGCCFVVVQGDRTALVKVSDDHNLRLGSHAPLVRLYQPNACIPMPSRPDDSLVMLKKCNIARPERVSLSAVSHVPPRRSPFLDLPPLHQDQ